MVVIVLHPSQEIEICRIIKELSKFCAQNDCIVYKKPPLWIPFDSFDSNAEITSNSDKAQLKKLIDKITTVQILPPQQNDAEIFCPVIWSYKNDDNKQEIKQFESKLILQRFLNPTRKELTSSFLSEHKTEAALFPMSLKIFRLANAIQLSKNTTALSDFVWKKSK